MRVAVFFVYQSPICAHPLAQVHFETATFGIVTFVFCCLKTLHKSKVRCVALCTFTCIALLDYRQQLAAQMLSA